MFILCGYRFGTELGNPFSDQQYSVQAEDDNMPLSEGFHWESLPGTPASTHWPQRPPPQYTTDKESLTETRSSSRMQGGVGQSSSTHEDSSQTAAAVPVKVEPNLGDENRDLRDDSSANKRKHNLVRVSSIIL